MEVVILSSLLTPRHNKNLSTGCCTETDGNQTQHSADWNTDTHENKHTHTRTYTIVFVRAESANKRLPREVDMWYVAFVYNFRSTEKRSLAPGRIWLKQTAALVMWQPDRERKAAHFKSRAKVTRPLVAFTSLYMHFLPLWRAATNTDHWLI